LSSGSTNEVHVRDDPEDRSQELIKVLVPVGYCSLGGVAAAVLLVRYLKRRKQRNQAGVQTRTTPKEAVKRFFLGDGWDAAPSELAKSGNTRNSESSEHERGRFDLLASESSQRASSFNDHSDGISILEAAVVNTGTSERSLDHPPSMPSLGASTLIPLATPAVPLAVAEPTHKGASESRNDAISPDTTLVPQPPLDDLGSFIAPPLPEPPSTPPQAHISTMAIGSIDFQYLFENREFEEQLLHFLVQRMDRPGRQVRGREDPERSTSDPPPSYPHSEV